MSNSPAANRTYHAEEVVVEVTLVLTFDGEVGMTHRMEDTEQWVLDDIRKHARELVNQLGANLKQNDAVKEVHYEQVHDQDFRFT
jgi:trehalose-6-phosphatase